jgi:thermitase
MYESHVAGRRAIFALRWLSIPMLLVLLVLMLGTGMEPAKAQTPAQEEASPVPEEGVVPGEILVKFEPSASATSKKQVHGKKGGRTKEVIPEIEVEVVRVAPGQEESRAADYQKEPNVRYAEPNGIYRAVETTDRRSDDTKANWVPNDAKVGGQWAFNNDGKTRGKKDADIDAFEAWDVTTGRKAVPIAVLDTGVNPSHEDLPEAAEIVNFSKSRTPDDVYGHGTHVAGTVAARTDNGRTGVSGTCPRCTLYNVKVLDDSGNGSYSSIAKGVRWAANNGAKVINMSLAGTGYSRTLEEAVDRAWRKGAVLVAAAGNERSHVKNYPAAYENVIAVAATDHHDRKAGFSNHDHSWVDVAAPGVGILSTTEDGGYGRKSGTSMATPHVAGVAGLVWSNPAPSTSNEVVREKIESSTDGIGGTATYWEKGRINACKAVGGTCDRDRRDR